MATPCDRLRACRYYVVAGYATGSSEFRRMRYCAAAFTSPGTQSATPMQRISGITRHCAYIVLRPAMSIVGVHGRRGLGSVTSTLGV